MKKKNCSSSPGRILVLGYLARSSDHSIYPAWGCGTHTGWWGVHSLRLTMDSTAPVRALRRPPSSSPGIARLEAGPQKFGMAGGRYQYLLGSTEVWHLSVRREQSTQPGLMQLALSCFSTLCMWVTCHVWVAASSLWEF